jgi:hypothetical protein
MNTMRPLILLLIACLLATVLGGCHSSVRFQPHAPYGAPQKFSEPLIVVLPDGFEEKRYTTDVGGFMRPRKFHVHYGEALKYETHARFSNMFTGVFAISQSDYAALDDRVEQEGIDMYSLPDSLTTGGGYVLDFTRVRFEIDGSRPIYAVDVTFSNRATGQELFRGLTRGRGTGITIRESTDFMKRELTEAVISANTSLLNPLSDRIRRAIAEEVPPPAPKTSEEATAEPAEEAEAVKEDTAEQEPPHPRLRPFFVTPE